MWSVHTANDIEAKGVPTVVLSTTAFASMGRQTAVQMGLPGLPILAAPHPFEWLSDKEIQEAATSLLPAIVDALTQPAEKVEEQYRDSWIEPPAGLVLSCGIPLPH